MIAPAVGHEKHHFCQLMRSFLPRPRGGGREVSIDQRALLRCDGRKTPFCAVTVASAHPRMETQEPTPGSSEEQASKAPQSMPPVPAAAETTAAEPASDAADIAAEREEFDRLDADASGFIDAKELREGLRRLNSDLSDETLQRIFETADENGDGRISFEEFQKQAAKAKAEGAAGWSGEVVSAEEWLSALGELKGMEDTSENSLEVLVAISKKHESDVHSIVQNAKRLIKCDRATLFLADHAKQELYSLLADGGGEFRLPITAGVAGSVATDKAREAINIEVGPPRRPFSQRPAARPRWLKLCLATAQPPPSVAPANPGMGVLAPRRTHTRTRAGAAEPSTRSRATGRPRSFACLCRTARAG